jgi:hypothetical protein
MRQRILIIVTIISCLLSSFAFASPSADIVYYETDLGNGSWFYDYTFYNNSTASETLYSVWLDFAQSSVTTGSSLPTGWDGTVWEGTNTTVYFETHSSTPGYDIVAGSSLGAFSFTIDYQAGDIPYTAYFDTGSGTSFINGITSIVPEPVSSVLFIAGAGVIGFRRFWRKSK